MSFHWTAEADLSHTALMEHHISVTVISLTATIAIIIAVLTLGPQVVSNQALHGDKVQHALGFGSMVVPAALLKPRWLRVLAPAVLVFGAAIEITQTYVGRDGEILDWVADATGILLAVVVCLACRAAFLSFSKKVLAAQTSTPDAAASR